MSDRITAVEAYENAIVKGDDSVAGYLADDVVVESNFGRAEGTGAALALLREPRIAGLLAAGPHWTEPAVSGDTVTVTAQLPATAPFGGVEFAFTFAGPKIRRVEQQTLPAAPVTPSALRLTDDIKTAVNGALDNQTPMMIAYSDDAGEIHLSFRGTIQAYSADRLALWAIFDNSHPRERQMDFRRGGAIVVDLDRVEGRGTEGRLLMVRSLA